MEIQANEAFDVYRQMYFEGGSTGSVYFWDLDDGFAGVVLLKKTVPGTARNGGGAQWDSIHVFEASEGARTSHYKLTSTVMLHLSKEADSLGEMNLSGNMTRQVESDMVVEGGKDEGHVANVGRLVEDMELKMRNLLQEVYFGKAKDVVGDLRSEFNSDLNLGNSLANQSDAGIATISETNQGRAAQRDVISSMGSR